MGPLLYFRKKMSAAQASIRGLTARSILIGAILVIVAQAIGDMTWLYTSKGGTINAFWIPFIYIVLLNELIGRANPRLRLKAQELVCIFPALALVNSIKYYPKGALSGGEALSGYIEKTIVSVGSGMNDPTTGEYWRRMTPPWMFPKDPGMIAAWQTGLTPGQQILWGEFLPPIIYWSLYTILMYYLALFLGFGLWGKRWVDTERLIFPLSIPMIYMIRNASDIDPATNKSRWFSIREPTLRVFWVAFFIGLIASLIPVFGEVIPPLAVFGAFAWGEQPILIFGLPSIMPGAMAKGVFQVDQVALWLLLPNNLLITAVLAYVVFGLLYQWIGVISGSLPYNPGMEFLWNWEDIPANWFPFPYRHVGILGMMVGLGIITLITLRSRFAELGRALLGRSEDEYGLSTRSIAWFGLIVVIAILALFTASGVPFIIALAMVIFAFIYWSALARVTATMWWHVDDFANNGGVGTYIFPLGVALGYWPATVPTTGTTNPGLFATGILTIPFNNTWTLRVNGFGPGGAVTYYKIARETGTNVRDALVAATIIIAIGVVFGYVWRIWLLNHGGGLANTNAWAWTAGMKFGNFIGGTAYVPIGATDWTPGLTYGLVGIIIVAVVWVLRSRFAWFFIDPTSLTMSMAVGLIWTWLSGLVALIIKVILIRTIGVRRFESYVIPIAAGISLGFGAPILLAGLIEFFAVVLPRFSALYVP
jgi:hypothetical protein